VVSTAAPTDATVPAPSGSPPAFSPAEIVTGAPGRTAPASVGPSIRTTSNADGSATSTSTCPASAGAPSTADMRVTTPLTGERSTESCWVRRAMTAAARAAPSSAAACSTSLRGTIPSSANRAARSYARCAAVSFDCAPLASALNDTCSNSTSGAPAATR